MRREFEALRLAEQTGRPTVLDTYGATNPAEFFAVATETFFDAPLALEAYERDVFAVLRDFYRQDPAARFPAPAASDLPVVC